jgi:hypothetical protein
MSKCGYWILRIDFPSQTETLFCNSAIIEKDIPVTKDYIDSVMIENEKVLYRDLSNTALFIIYIDVLSKDFPILMK